MRINRFVLILLISSIFPPAFAQTQQGFVKTIGRPDKKGVALSGVSVRVKGGHNAVLSKDDGTFSMLMTGMKVGDSYSLQQVQKTGYELNEKGTIGRQYAFSDRVPLTIVMVSTSQLQADKQRIENNAYKVAEKNYHAMLAQLEKDKEAGIITIETYRQGLQDLQDKFEKYQSLIDGLAEHYAHVDYDNLDEKEREINICIEDGELERADSLLHTIFDPVDVLKRNKDAFAEIEQQEAHARDILVQANADMAAVLKQQEKDAEYLYQLYTFALARYDNDKALQFIETRAALDTMNVQWQIEAGQYICNYIADYDKAISYYQLALRLSVEQYGEESHMASTAYSNIGLVYYNEGDFPKALEYNNKALTIREKTIGSDNLLVATSYNNIGGIYEKQGDYSKALENYFKALSIIEKTLGSEHILVARAYNNIGEVYKDQGKYLLALDYHFKALTIVENMVGAESLDVASSYNNIGVDYSYKGDYPEALEYFLKSLAILERVLGITHPIVATAYLNIGATYGRQGDSSMALNYLFKSLEVFEGLLGLEHHKVGSIYSNIGLVYYDQGNYPKALEYNNKALAIFEAVLGSEHPNVATTYSNIGMIYDKQGNYSKALEYNIKALTILKKVLGIEHPDVAMAYLNIGIFYEKQGDGSKAYEYYAKSLAIFGIVNGTDDPYTKKIKEKMTLLENKMIAKHPEKMKEFVFTATVIDGDTPARRQQMSGEYIVLEFADWSIDCIESLYDTNIKMRGKPKIIVVMKDETISKHYFENIIGVELTIRQIGMKEKERIIKKYHQWKKQ